MIVIISTTRHWYNQPEPAVPQVNYLPFQAADFSPYLSSKLNTFIPFPFPADVCNNSWA